MENEVKDYLKHFGEKLITKEIEEFAIEKALKNSRYIFIEKRGKERYSYDPLTEERIRLGKQQYGYCTYCNKEYETEGLKHNEHTICPGCGSKVKVKSSGISRKNLYDRAYFIHYEKSKINKEVIVAKGIFVIRRYEGDYKNIKNSYHVETLYIFEINNPVMLTDDFIDMQQRKYCWGKRSKVFPLSNLAPSVYKSVNRESIEKAVVGTPYQYSMYKEYERYSEDGLEYFELFSKYPKIEDLTKIGFKSFIEAKLTNRKTYNAINWNGKTVFKMLRVNRAELKELRSCERIITPCFMKLYQLNKKENTKLSIDEIKDLERVVEYCFEDLKKILKYTSLYRASKYIKNQEYKYINKFHRGYLSIGDWKDYINDCIKLKMDLRKENVLFPKDLYKAHQSTIKQVKYQEDKLLDEKMKKREEELNNKYYFEDKDYVIRAVRSTKEIIDEGKALYHCVGGYAERHSNGKTNILVVREKNNIDKPFFTMEINNNRIVQVRGLRNCAPDKKLDKFLNKFKARKIEKIKAKRIA